MAALLADIFGIIHQRPYLFKVEIALAAGKCAHLI
jgi:hypothetical protein